MKIYIENLENGVKLNITDIILDTMELESHHDITDDNGSEALDLAASYARRYFKTDDIDAYAI
jgi:hypothetical protein